MSKFTGISGSQLLAVIFITLKLLDKIDWSWWWVLSPLWIPYAIAIAIVLILMASLGSIVAAEIAIERWLAK